MVKIGNVELNIEDYRNFLLCAIRTGYVLPVRKDRVYVTSELPPFFETAQSELEDLLSQVKAVRSNPTIMYEFHIVGHGMTGTNVKGRLTGWSGEMLSNTYRKGDKTILGGIELALAQIEILPEDELSKRLIGEMNITKIDLDKYYVKFVGDLPRQIHHALLLTGDKELAKKLKKITTEVSNEISTKGNLYDVRIYHELMELALENNFIPTPLLRAQFYGPLELAPEKLKSEQKQEFIEAKVQETRQNYIAAGKEKEFNEAEARKEAEDLAKALIQRKDLLFAHRDNGGHYITENRFDLVTRLAHFYDAVMNNISDGNKILVITSSGCIDVSPFFFRYLANRDEIRIKTPKKKERGNVLVVKIEEYEVKGEARIGYINDTEPIEEILEKTSKVIDNFKTLSHDKVIKKGDGIIEAEFFALNKKEREEKDEKTTVRLTDILRWDDPTLILGNCGLGKTTFSLYLTLMLMPSAANGYNKNGKLVPILVRLRNVSADVSKEPTLGHRLPLMKELMNSGLTNLPKRWLEEYKNDGYRFVLILDGYDEVHPNYANNVYELIQEFGKQGHKVILTSRVGGFQRYERGNIGYHTVNIDPEAITRKLDEYLEVRIDDEQKRLEFKDFILKQSADIRENWLNVSLLTRMYLSEPSEIDLSKEVSQQEILHKGIRLYVWEHGLERDPSLVVGTTEADKREAKEKHLAEMMPGIQRIGAYIIVTDQPVITPYEVDKTLKGKWSLQTEIEYRQGKRPSRFLE